MPAQGAFPDGAMAEFQLIETLRWTSEDGYFLLDRHLARLRASADFFGFRCDAAAARASLDKMAGNFGDRLQRVRLLLGEDGKIAITASPLAESAPGTLLRYIVSDRRTDSQDVFLRHKTTNRVLYEDEFARHQAATGCDEVLFVNERGEVTEGSRFNLFVERDGRLLTPPLRCGLLDGTLRRELIERPDLCVQEKVLTLADLAAGGQVYLGNSVRGLLPACAVRLDPEP
jgi:para-aminobenzoate synthetase/4-amino-4-deoxychorismate lyase